MGPPKSHSTPLIRPATVDDAPALARLGALVFRHTYGCAIPPAVLDAYLARTFAPATIRQALTNGNTSYLVAAQAEHLIGYSKYAATPPLTCVQGRPAVELVNLYIHPTYQGNGIGRQLLQETVQVVIAQAPTTLWLCVWQANQRAIAFYQRSGFTIVGATEVYVDNILFDDWVMQRAIQ